MPTVLSALPDPARGIQECPKRARQQLDLLLLAIEAMDLDGSEALLRVASELKLQPVVGDRVNLWRLRSTNPLRRNSQRQPLTLKEAKALTLITCHLARRLTATIRQLLLAHQQLQAKGLSVDHNFGLAHYLERFTAHFHARMNPKRAAVVAYQDSEKINQLALDLLSQLLFCTGTAGPQRLWASLFDGEIA
ncbi:MAG: DUF3038 domain-containing protein [Cyanobacteria bacterium P01_A01_bin.135]